MADKKEKWTIKSEMNLESIKIEDDLETVIKETLQQLDKPLKNVKTKSGLKTYKAWHRDNRKVIQTLITMGLINLEKIYEIVMEKPEKADNK